METSVEDGRGDEGKTLKQPTIEFISGHLAALVRDPSISKLLQLPSLFNLTVSVGIGCLYRYIRY
jgi:hypothetical protein